jgi:hypothetical protein
MKTLARLLGTLVTLVIVLASNGVCQGQSNAVPPEYQSYLAHIAAAAASLRLNDTAAAKRWLAGAPEKYRHWEWDFLNAQAEQCVAVFPS